MANLFIKLSGAPMGYTCHDAREYGAILSAEEYLHDRIIHVHIAMVSVGHDPYTLWGYRTWGAKGSLHPKRKAYDTCDYADLQRPGGTGWNTSDKFKADLIVCGTIFGFYSGVNWSRYGKPWGDWAHFSWTGKIAKLSKQLLKIADPRLVKRLG